MTARALGDEQATAARSDARHAMIIAPPGCGKTEVLAHRAEHLIQFLGPHQRILALTFTNRAKANLEERLRDVLGYERMHRFVTVRNFHGHASQIVLAHGRTIGMDLGTLQLPKTSTLPRALEETGEDPDSRRAAAALLDEMKRAPLSEEEVLTALAEYSPDPVADLALKVETARQAANQLHYQDLLRHAHRLLLIPAIGHLYHCHFGAVLVDEFQDLSIQKLDIARLSCAARQTYAGDSMQGIFSWAGAAPEEVGQVIQQSCGDPIVLRESYRSSPRVLATVNSMSKSLGAETKLVSAQPERWADGGCSAALVTHDPSEEANVIVALTRSILARNSAASVGIITRSAWRRQHIDDAFAMEEDFTVRRWDLALGDPRVVALINQTVASLPNGATVESAHLAVLKVVDPSDVDTLEQVDDAFAALGQTQAGTARAALKSIRVSDPKQAVSPGVHLLNAHTGKGQQFDWVFVIGMEERHLPDRRSTHGRSLVEEQRVLLVMLSRARHGLIVTRVQMNDGRFGPYAATRSRWWETIESDFTELAQVEAHVATLPRITGPGLAMLQAWRGTPQNRLPVIFSNVFQTGSRPATAVCPITVAKAIQHGGLSGLVLHP
jgi:DNA helicase II / ATP-dependent DNA helicase PcrA